MDDEGDYFGVVIPFAAHCGVEPVLMADGRAELRLASTRRHENSIGMTHGGMLMTLLDMPLVQYIQRVDESIASTTSEV